MTVSVVISVRNGEPFIAETIESLLAQGPCVGEIIVANDGSTDGTAEVVRSFGDERVKLVEAQRRGLPAGRNAGAEVATGEWLFFIDADDICQPGALDGLLAAAETMPEAGVVYGDYDRIRSDGSRLGRRRHFMGWRRKPSGDVLERIVANNFMVIGIQIVKRSIYERLGGFDETLKVSDDWQFWCKAAAITQFLFVPALYVMSYRVHDTSIMHTKPLPFEAFVPGLDSVFSDERVRARLGPRLPALRQRAEASKMGYISTIAVRLGAYGTAVRMLVRAIGRAPATAPKRLFHFAGAFVGL